MKRYFLSTICMCFIALQLTAQNSYFTCDFEDAAQNAQWSLTNGSMAADIPNKWYIGSAISNGGKNAMYISMDGGQTVSYKDCGAYVISYIEVHLDKGNYNLSFDWCAMGNTADNSVDGLYALWAPLTDSFDDPLPLNSNKSTIISKDLEPYILEVTAQGDQKMVGSATWKNAVAEIKSDGTPRRLAFLWLVGDYQGVVSYPAPCIDNIMIMDAESCPSPTALSVSTDGQRINMNWVGNASQYEVKCYSYMDESWTTQIVSDTTATTLTGITEGLCDLYVSSICDDGKKSIPLVRSEYFLYYPANHCIDYLTLDSSNCYIAEDKVSASASGGALLHMMKWKNTLVNNGYAAKESRHTIHYSWNETDPRTCGGLRTVPEGELASVRLGNWNTGSEAERAEFKFHVDAKKNPVLMLKYAVVLQKPGDGCKPNPGFLLRVLDENGQLVSNCASADFDFKKAADAEWELCYPEGNSNEVRWKDWTTVGVNLAEFDGQTLTIQLTTYDCGAGGHYGYAYFTLGCSDGKLTGMSCGVENTEFIAPDGFVYQWYLQSNPDSILGHDQKFEVLPTDTNHYVVDMMFAQDSSCYFSLVASAQPYQPYAEATMEYKSVDCKNIVQFTNLSHIIETNQITDSVTHTTKPVDWVEWDFGDGKTSYEENPEHVFSNEGGPINVKLIAHLSTCVDTLYLTDTLPAIGMTYDTLLVNQCAGTGYTYSYYDKTVANMVDTTLTKTGVYDFTLTSVLTGCDSIVTINLTVLDTLWTNIDTLIMKGETITIGEQTFSKTGTYNIPFVSTEGCDSVVVLDLTVYDFLMVDALQNYTACHGDKSFYFEYAITQGTTDTYSLNIFDATVENKALDSKSIEIDIPTDAIPNIYKGEITFIDTIGENVIIPFQLYLAYNANVVTQRWNDVLAVKNSEYNGGFTFAKYQWYKMSEADFTLKPLSGQTLSYLYQPKGLDTESVYSVGLTREGETVEIRTCAIYPEDYSDIDAVPTLVGKSQPMQIKARGNEMINGVAYWTMFNGMTIATQQIVDGIGVTAPSIAGLYLLTWIDQQGNKTTETILVQ